MTSKVDVFGTDVSLCSVDEVARRVVEAGPTRPAKVAIGNVHSVMTARRHPDVAEALNGSDVVTPDGMPLVWAMRIQGHDAARVTGIEVMEASFAAGLDCGLRHFFYGSSPEVLESMIHRVRRDFPGVVVCGAISPPFRRLTLPDLNQHVATIRRSKADVVWVGLGMPKQELWMHDVAPALPGVTLVGVGAAFDWYGGKVRRAPGWMQRSGLEWLYRLTREPRRLWRRYAWTNPGFVLLLIWSWLRGAWRRGLSRDSVAG